MFLILREKPDRTKGYVFVYNEIKDYVMATALTIPLNCLLNKLINLTINIVKKYGGKNSIKGYCRTERLPD